MNEENNNNFSMRETLIEIYKELENLYPEQHGTLGVDFSYPENLPGVKIKIRFEKENNGK